MSEDSLERYGGVLAAPARPGWRTVLGVLGTIHVIVAAMLTAVVVTPHGTDLGGVQRGQPLVVGDAGPCAFPLAPGTSTCEPWRSARTAGRWLPSRWVPSGPAGAPTCGMSRPAGGPPP